MELALIAVFVLWQDVRRRRAENLAWEESFTAPIPPAVRSGVPRKRYVTFAEGKVRWMWDRLANPTPPPMPGVALTREWWNLRWRHLNQWGKPA